MYMIRILRMRTGRCEVKKNLCSLLPKDSKDALLSSLGTMGQRFLRYNLFASNPSSDVSLYCPYLSFNHAEAFLSGAFPWTTENKPQTASWNVYLDPIAAAQVYGYGFPLVWPGYDSCDRRA